MKHKYNLSSFMGSEVRKQTKFRGAAILSFLLTLVLASMLTTTLKAQSAQIYNMPHVSSLGAEITPSTTGTATSLGDLIVLGGASTKRVVDTIRIQYFTLGGAASTSDLTISLYTDCSTDGTSGSACGNGLGTLIPGSTQTITVPSTGGFLFTATFVYTGFTLDLTSETDNTISVVLNSSSPSYYWQIGDSPIIGSQPSGEGATGAVTRCGSSSTNNGCARVFSGVQNNFDIEIKAHESILIELDQSISCHGNTDGSIQASTSLTGSLSYDIDGQNTFSNTTGFFSGLAAGTHTVCVTNGTFTSCGTITLIEPDPLAVTFVTDSLERCGGLLGGLSAVITGGTIGPLPGYGTEWTNSASTILNPFPDNYATSITGLNSGVYSLYVEDYNFCTLNVSTTLQNLCLQIDQEISCFGANDGTVQAATTAAGSWLFGIDGGTINNPSGLFIGLTPGTHTVCMSDGTNTYCDTISLIEPDALAATFTVDSTVSCLGNDGALTISITGGSTGSLPGYLTVWSNSTTNPLNDQLTNNYATSLTGLTADTYTVHVEDDRACVADFTTTLGLTTPVSVTATSTPILCNGGTSVITPSSAGGLGTLTNTIAPGGSFTVSAGTYTVTATDTKGCTSTTEIVVSQPNALSAVITADSLAGCTASEFGGISASITGGTGPYTTVWTNSSSTVLTGPSSTTLTGLVPDTYSLQITDANNCVASSSYYLPSLCLMIDQEISCHGQTDGTVQASTSSAGTWMYGIDGGALNNPSGLFIGLAPGTHTICASNNGGVNTYCDTISLVDPLPLSASFVVDSTVSCHNNDGALSIIISGGAIGVGYLTVWTNSTNDTLNDQLLNNYATSLTGLAAGSYTVHVEDDHACVADFTTTLGFTTPVSVTATATTIACFGGTSVITPSSAGGLGTLTNTIAPGGSFTVSAGTYTVTATDTKGCTSTTEIVVSQPNALSAVITADSLAGCTASEFGGISASITGGTGPYTTVWTNSSSTVLTGPSSTTLTGLVPDTYSLQITDANNCVASSSYYLPSLCLMIDQEISCHGQTDGTVQASTSSAGTWMYGIDGGALNNPSGLFIGLAPGTHTICASNNGGVNTYCDTISLVDPLPLSASFVVDSTVSCHNNDGALSIIISGGAIGVGYLTVWTNSTNDTLNDQLLNNYATSLTGLAAGSYTVHVEDDHACVADFTTTLGFTTPVSVTATATTIACFGGTSVITPSSAGGLGTLTNTIAPGGSFTVTAGTYTVTATDTKGCTSTTEIVITEPALISSSSSATACNSYTWNAPGTGATYTVSGSYTNTLVAANNCDSIITLNLTINYTTTSSQTEHVANTYTWPVNGVTYTAAGTYTHTLTNAASCDSILTLNLDLIDLTLFVDQEISCNGANDGTVQASTSVAGTWMYGIDGGALNNPSGLFIGLTPGTHTICANNGTNSYCETVSLTEPAVLSATFTIDSTVSCHNNDGMITLNISGGTMGIGYLTVWTNAAGDTLNDQNTNNYALYLQGLAAGDYFVHIEDERACTANVDTTLLFTTPLVVTASASPIVCFGGTTTVNATSTDGYQPATYAIGSTPLPASFSAGTYTVTATDTKGCTATTEIVLANPANLVSSQTATSCDTYTWAVNNTTYTTSGSYTAPFTSVNGCDSSVTLNLTINYTTSSTTNVTAAGYTWPVNGTTYTTSGTYVYTMVNGNSNGCDSVLTLNFSMLTIELLTNQDISCFGANDGSVIATATGGTGSFTYDIDGGTTFTNNTGEFYGLTPGLHTICAKESPSNALVCDTITVLEPAPLTATFTIDSLVSCNNNDGMISLNISGGTFGIGYLTVWTNAAGDTINDQNTNNYATNLGGLPSGTYNVHIEDDHGCTIDVDTVLNFTTPLAVTASASPIMCFGGSTIISATSTDGYQPATYAIGSTPLPASFTAGTYTVTATDTKGCTATTEIILTQPPFLPISQTATACNTYTWNVNNQTYTTSGNYIANFTSVNGCDSSYSLALTINYTTSSVENVTAADTYTWIANNVTYTASGTYTTTLVGGNSTGCDSNLTLNLVILNITAQVDQNVSCNGNNDGSLVSAATGGSGNFTYDIDGGTAFTNTTGSFSGLTPGVHTVCAKESPSNVIVCTTLTITEPNPISIVLTVDSTVSCLGNDGGISAVVTGGTTSIQPYLTTWSAGATPTGIYDMSVTGLTPGTYTLTVEDDNLCFASASITVGITTPLTVTETHTALLCYGQTSVITPTTNGGTGAVTTSISGGTYTVTGGTYTITATDAKGCTATTEVVIPTPVLYVYSETQTSCNSYTWFVNGGTYTTSGIYTASYTSVNGCDSSYTLNLTVNYSSSSVETITAADTYTWAANGVTYTASGTYTHTIVGGNSVGCDSNLTLNLTILNISAQVDQNVSCNGNNDGSIVSSATGGSGNFTYDLDGANLFTNTTGSFIGLTPGTHTICAKESPSNVTVCATVTITEPAPISIVLTVDSTVSCLGNDGGISAVVTGGTTTIQPYLTTWSAGASTTGLYDLSVTGLTPGMYTLTVEDDNLCFATASINVALTTPLSVDVTYTPIQCYGGSTVLTPVITGGTGTITTTITGGSYTVTAGTYTISSVDAKGCTASTVVTLTQPPLTYYYDTQVACSSYTWPVNNQTFTTSGTYIASYTAVNGCDSVYSLNLTINYPTSSNDTVTAANSYTWAANGVTYTTEGTYTHTLVGGNSTGCDSSLTIHIHIITISVLTDQNISCFGANDGSALATANGGTHNFVYDLDGANLYTNTTGSFVNLTPGNHTICAKEIPSNVVACGVINIAEPSPISAYFIVDSTVSCFGNDGQLSIVISGGTTILQPYLTAWTNSTSDTLNDQNTNNFALTVGGLPVGNYYVRVEDDLGCFTTFDTTLSATPALTLSANATTILCNGGTSTISASSTGGLAPLVYTVGSTVLPATFPGGTYTVTATDVKGCTSTAVLNIVEPPLYAYSQTETVCDSYTWSQNSQTYTASGVYTSSYTSVNGCDSTYTLNLTVNYSSSSVTNVTSTGYTWPVTGITYTATGVYTATLTNAAGCDSILTLNFYLITMDVLLDQNVSCNGSNDGSAIATAVGGTGNFSYDLDGANTYANVTGSFYGLTPGTHTICAMESPSGAIVCGTVTITQPDPISIVLTVDSTVSCLGNDGGISAVVTGGTTILQPYLTTWSGGVNSGSPYDSYVTGLTPGTYTLTVEDDHACFATASITVGNTAPVTVTATNTTIACYGGTSVITPTTGGGTGSIATTISGGSFTVVAGTYTITATDAKGCTGTTEIVISEPSQISSTSSVTACNSYMWTSGSGSNYTTSGTYTHNLVGGAANGCDSLLILNLTINNSDIHATQNATACNTYTWSVNNATYTTSGIYNATYTNANGCDSSYSLNLVVNYSSSSTTTVTSTTSYTWNANNVTYTASGVYTATLLNASGCDSVLTLNLTIAGITISPKVFLDGPYVAADGMMHDSLRSQGLIPNTEPYTAAPFSKPNILDSNPAEHQVSNAVLAITGNNAIVDWVFVELRSASNPSTIVATKRALVQRDGDVVSSVDGMSPIYFSQNAPGNYYVSIKHRNHLGVMTLNALPLVMSSTTVDFTTTAPVYYHVAAPPITNAQRKVMGSVTLLWAGDANSNKNVKYNGLANDKQEILNAVGVATPNNTVAGYRLEDVNMDGIIRYNNTDNDKNYILNFTVGISTPNAVISQHTPN